MHILESWFFMKFYVMTPGKIINTILVIGIRTAKRIDNTACKMDTDLG